MGDGDFDTDSSFNNDFTADQLLKIELGCTSAVMNPTEYEGTPKRLRLDLWEHFSREGKFRTTRHPNAFCKFCSTVPGMARTPIRGEKRFLEKHLANCPFCPETIREKVKRSCENHAENSQKKHATAGGSQDSGSSQSSSTNRSVDKPLDKNEQKKLDLLVARTWISAGFSWNSLENPDVVELFRFLRPSVKLPSRAALSSRSVQEMLDLAVKETFAVLGNQKFVTIFINRWEGCNLFLVTAACRLNGATQHFFLFVDDFDPRLSREDDLDNKLQVAFDFLRQKHRAEATCVICEPSSCSAKTRRSLTAKFPSKLFLPSYCRQMNAILKDLVKIPYVAAVSQAVFSVLLAFNQNLGQLIKFYELRVQIYGSTEAFPVPTETRWHAFFQLFTYLSSSELALKHVVHDASCTLAQSVVDTVKSDTFWVELNDVIRLLKALTYMEEEFQRPTVALGDVMKNIAEIYRLVVQLSHEEVKVYLKHRLERQWKLNFDPYVMILSSFFDPALRTKLFKPQMVTMPKLGAWASELYLKYFGKEPTLLAQSLLLYKTGNPPFDARSTSFLKDPVLFWQYMSEEHQELSELAVFLLSVCPYPASCDAASSFQGSLRPETRSRVKREELETRLAVQYSILRNRNSNPNGTRVYSNDLASPLAGKDPLAGIDVRDEELVQRLRVLLSDLEAPASEDREEYEDDEVKPASSDDRLTLEDLILLDVSTIPEEN